MSSYPMFSGRRADASVEVVLAVGDGSGGHETLPTEATGHRHLTQAVRALREAVQRGGDHPRWLCEEAADWASRHRPGINGVRIVTARFEAMAFLRDGERDPDVLAEHASCSVPP